MEDNWQITFKMLVFRTESWLHVWFGCSKWNLKWMGKELIVDGLTEVAELMPTSATSSLHCARNDNCCSYKLSYQSVALFLHTEWHPHRVLFRRRKVLACKTSQERPFLFFSDAVDNQSQQPLSSRCSCGWGAACSDADLFLHSWHRRVVSGVTQRSPLNLTCRVKMILSS